MIEYSQWKDYLERSGDDHKKLYPAQNVLSDPDKGFLTFDVNIIDKYIFVYQMYGNGRHWIALLKRVARQNGITEIRWFTKRNPETIERKYGAKITGYTMTLEIE